MLFWSLHHKQVMCHVGSDAWKIHQVSSPLLTCLLSLTMLPSMTTMMGQIWRKMPYYVCPTWFLIQAIDKIALDIYLPQLLGLDCGILIQKKRMKFCICFTFATFNCAKLKTIDSTKRRKWKIFRKKMLVVGLARDVWTCIENCTGELMRTFFIEHKIYCCYLWLGLSRCNGKRIQQIPLRRSHPCISSWARIEPVKSLGQKKKVHEESVKCFMFCSISSMERW